MWAQNINAALGIWLMVAPAVLGYGGLPQDHDHIVGPTVATFAIIAWWESTRKVGRVNLVIGLWLLLAPWVLGYEAVQATVNSMIIGALLAALSPVKGTFTHRFGGGWKVLWEGEPNAAPDAHNPRST